MVKISDNQIEIKDEKGNTKVFEILFTYENEERGKQYVFFYDPENEDEIITMSYDGNDLFEIDDDEEYAEVEEVFNAYVDDPKINEAK